ncbi:unnamed protein product [Medioppia subpectinata]|uniref:PDZ domain-containing protein n=1 Tax=Medioppia subpectinata TaxID=1979941 RepID=A0A7R9PXQ2_9ACAR|nr:unnamed protein product [Medioppia subpectinata]CAG2105252.1 unnamed protein product [Medioppia subpectinata]
MRTNVKIMIFYDKSADNCKLKTRSAFNSENISLRRQTLQLQSELFGSRLAAKYLDKELAGRIQQIQLLGRDAKDADHDRLWNQLEAEIHLHRHKTVIRACRANCLDGYPLAAPPQHNSLALKKRQGVGVFRFVTIDKDANQGLGISITGGKEHGVPIIISQIHANTAAARCGALYVGDAILSVNQIDLRDAKHADAAYILSNQSGECVLEVVFVAPDEQTDDEEYVGCADGDQVITGLGISGGNYPFYDSQVIDANAIESNDYYNNQTINETESLDGSASQANETIGSVSSSPTKRYPGKQKEYQKLTFWPLFH